MAGIKPHSRRDCKRWGGGGVFAVGRYSVAASAMLYASLYAAETSAPSQFPGSRESLRMTRVSGTSNW